MHVCFVPSYSKNWIWILFVAITQQIHFTAKSDVNSHENAISMIQPYKNGLSDFLKIGTQEMHVHYETSQKSLVAHQMLL